MQSAKDEPHDRARRYFLHQLAILESRVLATLNALGAVEDSRTIDQLLNHDRALEKWRAKWDLPSWALEYARDTLQLWRGWPEGRGQSWSFNRAGAAGELVPETGRPAKRPADLIVPARHFDWLIAHEHSGARNQSIITVASDAGVNETTVRRAVDRLARLSRQTPPNP